MKTNKEDINIFDGHFGLERETLRINQAKTLAPTAHPFKNPLLSRDFCENQLEIITPVCQSIDETLQALEKLDTEARKKLDEMQETLWLYSNPPHFEVEDDIPVARYEKSLSHKHDYRLALERRYGKRLMLYSGIHFNFSFTEENLKKAFSKSGQKDFQTFRSKLYLKLAKHMIKTSWLIVLLTAASPVFDRSLKKDHAKGLSFSGYASLRNSRLGYWNQFVPTLDFSSLKKYVESISYYIEKGLLFSASELYLPIRLKSRGANSLKTLLEKGIDHIELRMFDLNPLEPLGIAKEDLAFAHLLLLYLAEKPDFVFTKKEQRNAVKHHKLASLFALEKIKIDGVPAKEAALKILDDLKAYFSKLPRKKENLAIIAYERRKLEKLRLCEKIRTLAGKDYESILNLRGK